MKTKAKTRKIVAKRFKLTKTGKILRRRQNLRHLRSAKSKRQLRHLKQTTTVSKGMHKAVRSFLPYG